MKDLFKTSEVIVLYNNVGWQEKRLLIDVLIEQETKISISFTKE